MFCIPAVPYLIQGRLLLRAAVELMALLVQPEATVLEPVAVVGGGLGVLLEVGVLEVQFGLILLQ